MPVSIQRAQRRRHEAAVIPSPMELSNWLDGVVGNFMGLVSMD
jgi:hypothetical protein